MRKITITKNLIEQVKQSNLETEHTHAWWAFQGTSEVEAVNYAFFNTSADANFQEIQKKAKEYLFIINNSKT